MKKYFKKIYRETGFKVFTGWSCLSYLLFYGSLFLFLYLFDSDFMIYKILSLVLAIGIIGFNLWRNNILGIGKSIGLTLMSLLATIFFFFSFFLIPFFKFSSKMAKGALQSNLGNTSASVSYSKSASNQGITNNKALSWFKYDGFSEPIKSKDSEYTEPKFEHHELSEGEFSYAENQKARNLGFKNAKEAQIKGFKI